MAISVGQANTLLDDTFVNQVVEVALHNGDPGAAGTANEVVGGSYARITGQFGTGASGGEVSSDADHTWSNMPEVTVSHVSVHSVTPAAFLWRAPLVESKPLSAGASFVIESGNMTFGFTIP